MRECIKECKVKELTIPKVGQVFIPIYSIHRPYVLIIEFTYFYLGGGVGKGDKGKMDKNIHDNL